MNRSHAHIVSHNMLAGNWHVSWGNTVIKLDLTNCAHEWNGHMVMQKDGMSTVLNLLVRAAKLSQGYCRLAF
jgi:hypothetical protein